MASNPPLKAQKLTWAVLLGRWIEFSRSALALPDTHTGRRLRDSVPDMIMLQAVWLALEHLEELNLPQRALGIDRADLLIEKHTTALRQRWTDDLPSALADLISDARQQLTKVASRTLQNGR